ncbi:MAG TPA: hypothetical protein VJ775_05450 [Sphingomicrobium sp.]|nr:hypothetical protein [Sphingomicrobium sp.]
MVRVTVAFSLAAAFALAGCKTDNMTDGVKSAGSAVVDGAKDVAGGAVSLVNVDLSNVLNDLALDLKVDKSNIPINAQIPVTVAANVCGVSINILSIGAGGGSSQGCTANSISPELKQYIQQQIAAAGNVGGGSQTNTGSTGSATQGTATTTPTPQQDPTTQPPQ